MNWYRVAIVKSAQQNIVRVNQREYRAFHFASAAPKTLAEMFIYNITFIYSVYDNLLFFKYIFSVC